MNRIFAEALKRVAFRRSNGEEEIWRVEGPFDTTFSLALVNRQLAIALDGHGRQAELCAAEGAGDAIRNQDFLAAHPHVRTMWQRGLQYRRASVVLRNLYPPRVTEMDGATRALGPYGWEESVFPDEHAVQFNAHLDLVVTMSAYVAKVLADSGVRPPIGVVGLGVDHCRAVTPASPRRPLGRSTFRFLHVSSCFPRKGLDALLEAWSRAFTAEDDVCLVVKTFPNPHNDAALQIAELGRRCPGHAEIVLIDEEWSDAEMAGLYLACDAVVIPSRGEGFGLPIGEAMWFERPVIATGYGGQMDFCDETTAWLVDYRFAYAQTHFGLHDSVWAEPDVDDLARLLRHLRAPGSAGERRRRVRAAKKRIERDFNWSAVARRTVKAVAAVRALPSAAPPVVAWAFSGDAAGRVPALTCAMPPEAVRLLPAADDPARQLPAIVAQRPTHAVLVLSAFAEATVRCLLDGLAAQAIPCTLLLPQGVDPAALQRLRDCLARCHRLLAPRLDDLNGLKQAGLAANSTLFPSQPDDWPGTGAADAGYRLAHEPDQVSARLWAILTAPALLSTQ